MTDARYELFLRCTPVYGHGVRHPADELERVAAIIRDRGIRPDIYGTGDVLTAFEAEVAELLGFPAARYMPSGCMAQPIALRIWADRANNRHTAFHATSHLELHEEHGYSTLHGLTAHLLGDPSRPTLAHDLKGLPPLSSVLLELPAREIGGQLPTWQQLTDLSEAVRSSGAKLHLDGARLWEAQPYYDRPLHEICALFDSAYVSFYKGIGALASAMLLGPATFIDEAALWQRRQGGTLHSSLAHIVSAQTRLAPQLRRIPHYVQRAQQIAAFWQEAGVQINPPDPRTNMFHLHFSASAEVVSAARDAVAEETGLWLMGGLRDGGLAAGSRTEFCIQESALHLDLDTVRDAIQRLGAGLAKHRDTPASS